MLTCTTFHFWRELKNKIFNQKKKGGENYKERIGKSLFDGSVKFLNGTIMSLEARMDQVGARAPWVQFFFLVIIFFIFVVRLSQNLRFLFFTINLTSFIQITTIYLIKKFNKNNKNIHNSDCILTKKKKLFHHQRTRKSSVIGEIKANFFATTVN